MKKILIMCLLTWGSSVTAGVITSASSIIDAPVPFSGGFNADNTIDQSGLSSSYISGVTDFDTYIAGSPTHQRNNSPANFFASPSIGNIDFDMGAALSLSRIAFWN